MKHAVIDVGSNSVRLVVFDVKEDGSFSIIWNKKAVAGLAGYIEDGRLSDAGIERAVDVIGRFIDSIYLMDVDTISVFGTAILRNIDNTEEACSRIERETGAKIDVLSGSDEAYLGYIGCKSHIHGGKGVIVDIGGGSTEITTLCDDRRRTVSLPFGSLSLFLKFVDDILPTKDERKAIYKYVGGQLDGVDIFHDLPYHEAIGLGGSARAAIKLVHDIVRIGDARHKATKKQLQKLLDSSVSDYKNTLHTILRICPERVHTVLPGVVALTAIMDHVGAKTLEVSKKGIREGYLLARVLGREPKTDPELASSQDREPVGQQDPVHDVSQGREPAAQLEPALSVPQDRGPSVQQDPAIDMQPKGAGAV